MSNEEELSHQISTRIDRTNEELSQEISTRIDQKLRGILSKASSNQIIFRIDNTLRMTYEAAYEPEMVSIGPYHRGKNNLQKMEKYKLEYLQGILKRQNESSARKYIDSLIEHEEEARGYYAEQVSLSPEEFVEMMLLDGCFIIEFLRKYYDNGHDHHDSDHDHNRDHNHDSRHHDNHDPNDHDHHDPIFKMEWILEIICRDLLLFENQIPFFILVKLFDMTKICPDNKEENLISLAISCLNDCIIADHVTTINHEPSSSSASCNSPPYYISQPENVFHLLSLMYESWCAPFAEAIIDSDDEEEEEVKNNKNNKKLDFSCINLENTCFGLNQTRKEKKDKKKEEEEDNDIVFIKSVTELKGDGIKFVKYKECKSWLDIQFENGEIKIPPLVIQDMTESILRNLIAYEQYMFDLGHSGKFVTDYATFMDTLINTPMDVQKLRVKGIIKNWMGNDEEISDMFNNIGNNVFLSPPDFTYRKIFKNVNRHCSERRNQWISDLKKTHFKNPWSVISLFAAIVLLVLTLMQTVLAFLQHFKKDPHVVCTCK